MILRIRLSNTTKNLSSQVDYTFNPDNKNHQDLKEIKYGGTNSCNIRHMLDSMSYTIFCVTDLCI